MPPRTPHRTLTLVVLLLLALAPAARANDIKAAKEHYARGLRAYEREQWSEAVKEFQAAYDLAKKPDILFNLSRAETRQGHEVTAIGYLKRYVAEAPDAPDVVSVRTEIEARERALRDKEEKTRAEAEAAAAQRRAEEAAAQARAAHEAVARARDEAERARHPRWPGALLMGGGVAFVAIGVGLGVVAEKASAQAESGGNDGSKFDLSIQTRGRASAATGVVMDVVGGAMFAIGTSVLVWAIKGGRHKPERKVWLAPSLGGLYAAGRF